MRTNQAQPELVKRLALGATDFDQSLVLRITQVTLKEIDWIDMLVFEEDFIVQMGGYGGTGISNITNNIAALYNFTGLNCKSR